MRLPVSHIASLVAITLLSACTLGAEEALDRGAAAPRTGPAGDYPMVIGDPFTVDGVTWTPADTMNYDKVGYAAVTQTAEARISAAHRTLPVPSYIEVTSLDTGRTILVRVERRGPMDNTLLLELSSGAAQQLGAAGDRLPVRVRRVNPAEPERAMLRTGQAAPARMDTPRSLVAVLSRKLAPVAMPPAEPAPLPIPTASPMPLATASPAAATAPAQVAAPTKTAPLQAGDLIVQVAAFSSKERADASARRIGGTVSRAAALWRVRAGPFATRRDAEAALARVRSAGYNDARILRAD